MTSFVPHFELSLALQTAGVVVLLAAALRDICSRQIPNQLVLAVLGLGALNLLLTPSPLLHLAGFAAVFAATVFFWRMGWLGGGDTKLLAAAALLVPAEFIPLQIAAITLVGGAMALAAIYGRLSLLEPIRPAGHRAWTPIRIARIEMWRIQHGSGLPYAMAIALGTFGAMVVCRGGVS